MLSASQLYVLAILAPIIVYVLKLLLKAKVEVSRGWLTAAVYVISGLLAYAWNAPAFPAFPGYTDLSVFIPALLAWLSSLLTLLGPVVAFATLIYNALLKNVLDRLSARIWKKE